MKKKLHYTLQLLCLLASVQKTDAQAVCPNGGFENWADHAYYIPDSAWFATNQISLVTADTLTVWPVSGLSGQAVHLQTSIIGQQDTFKAQIELGNTPYALVYGPFVGQGGVPYAQKPTAITGYYRYDLPGNDSALIEVAFKKAGAIIADSVFKFRGSGSLSAFTPFAFPLSLGVTPDSVVILAASSNIYGAGIESGSWLELDQLAFTGPGITQNIPGSFDSWQPQAYKHPTGWNASVFGITPSVAKSAIHYSGSYSVQLTTQPYTEASYGGTVSPAYINNGYGSNSGLLYTDTMGIIAGYYMYIPSGQDSAVMYAFLTKNMGTAGVGGVIHYFSAASSWTYFEAPVHAFVPPDSLIITFESGSDFAALPGSILRIDSLHITDVSKLAVTSLGTTPYGITIYPDPAHDELSISFGEALRGATAVKLYDMTGRLVESRNYEATAATVTLSVAWLPGGMYLCEISNNGTVVHNKFMKN